MQWKQLALGPIQTNCYILQNASMEALIIDPGDEAQKVIDVIKNMQIKPLAILLTHAHFDHIGAIDYLRDEWSIPVYLHHIEKDWLSDPNKNGSSHFPIVENMKRRPADNIINSEITLTLGDFTCHVIETPGHSPGSVSYYFPEEHVVFSGDVIMNGSIGRTDLLGGDYNQLMSSIYNKVISLPEETIIAPGHGLDSTVGKEKSTNPFL